MVKISPEKNELRKTLSINIKKHRKTLGLTQEKLAEATGLSFQTINDIEGCRMWVSDKTIYKLSQVLLINAYELFTPKTSPKKQIEKNFKKSNFLSELEGKIIRNIKRQFENAKTDNVL